MMERKYQLVAWTENITDNENARLYLIPSFECEVQADLITDLTFIHQEEYKFHGPISLDLARRAVKAYENMSRFDIFTGHPGDGIRYLFFAAQYCIWEDETNRTFREKLRLEFARLCEKGMHLAKKYRREDVLLEKKPRHMLELYYEHTPEKSDFDTGVSKEELWNEELESVECPGKIRI